jgi:CheY-like chemotaxis protein
VKNRPAVLLVDDNEINLNLLKALMTRAKRRYVAVHNGLEAVHAYERASKHPDTAFTHVLMDISMPVMDGITATRLIRDYERGSALERPTMVVALSGLASETTQKEMFEAGGDYFMPKPIQFKELMKLLDR